MSDRASRLITLARLKAEVEEMRREVAMKEQFGILFYKPHDKQDLFHRAGKYKRRYARTGNRFGKSTMGVAEDVSWVIGYRPFYEEGDEARYVGIPQRSVKILIIVADWGKAHEVLTNRVKGQGQGKIFKMLPEESIVDVKTRQGNIYEIHVKSKWGGVSSIHITTVQSFKTNPMGQESSDFDAIHVDEPCPEAMWKAVARGLVDRGGSAWFTCTPIMEPWINDMFMKDGNYREQMDEGRVVTRSVNGLTVETWMMTGSMTDNAHNSAQAVAEFMDSLTEEDRETRIDGRPANLTGAIYKEFDPTKHVYYDAPRGWKDFDIPPINYTLRLAIDTHPSTPHAALVAATAPSGHTFFFAEVFEKLYVPQLCDRLWMILGGRYPLRCLLEQAAYNENPFEGQETLAQEFMNYKVPFPVEPAVKDLSYGILKVKHALSRRDEKGNPYLLFSHSLHETIKEFDRYVWDPKKPGKPVDKYDHMMENLYRLVLTGLEYVEPEEFTMAPQKQLKGFELPTMSVSLAGFTESESEGFYKSKRYRR